MARATILVVEDERLVARGIQDNLEHLGYAVAGPVFSGEEAIARVQEKKPDLILMDIFLAGNMDGIAAAERIKAMVDTPVIYLTAYADPTTLERAKVTEPYGYILKPYEERDLHSTIEMALYKSRSEKRLHHVNELLESIRKIQTTIFREKDRQRLLHQVSQLLTGMRGYARAWIALVDGEGRVAASAAVGRGKGAADLEELLKQGDLPECGRRYLGQSDVMAIPNTLVSCTDCTCQQEGEGLGALLVGLAHQERRYGILGVCLADDLAADAHEMSLLQEMADDIALALHNMELAEQARTYEAALAASEAKYRLVFDNAPLGFMHYDQDGTIIAVNDAFAAVMGSSREQLLGFQMRRQLRDERMIQAVNDSLAGGLGYYEGEYLSVTGGKTTPLRAFYRSIFAENGDFLGGVCIIEDYTEKFQVEREKQESLNFLQILMDAMPNPVFYKDTAGRYLGLNKATEQAWGRPREDFIGKTVFDLHPPDLAAIYQARDQGLFQNPGIQIYETQMANPDGSRREVVLHKATFFHADGALGGLIGVVADITDRKRMEEALRESERRLSLAQGIAHIGNWEWEVDSGETFWSAEVYRIFGLEPGAAKPSYELAREHTHPDDLELWQTAVQEAVVSKDEFRLDYRGLRADGSLVWIHNEAQVIRDGKGRAVKLVGTAQDITERKQAEEALRESEERLRLAGKATNDVIWDWDVVSDRQLWNDAGAVVFGWEDIVRQPQTGAWWTVRVHPDDRQRVADGFYAVLESPSESHWEDEYKFRKKDGSYALVYDRGYVMRNEKGEAVRMIGAMLDITARQQAEEALRESEARYRALMETAADAIVLAEVETGKILEVNEKTASLLGRDRAEIIGQPITFLHPQEDEDYYRQNFEAVIRQGGGTVGQIMYAQHRDGHRIPLEIGASLCELAGRQVVWGIFRDVTERLQAQEEKDRLEAQLYQTQKLEAVGTLAGGIAHDFNNILWAILGYTEMTLMSLPEHSQERFNLEQVMQAGRRARDLVNQILAFSRKSVKERKPFRLSLIVKEALKLLRATLPTTIIFRHQIMAPGALVLADITQLHQVVMNLCTNAAQAMEETGGTLFVGLEELVMAADNQDRYPDLSTGPYVALTVSDTGPGIEPALLPRIFEPFFTTKGVGKGSGLGLSVVHGIVKSHGGEIIVTSQPERGSTFTVFLPICAGEVQAGLEVCTPIPTGTNRILCVDDEPMLVDLLQAELGKLGYEVTTRTSSLEALETFRANPEDFDLVITDQTMPHCTGMQLAREVRGLRPGIPIIICTGYSDKVSEATIKEAGIREMFMKPVDLRQLAEGIRRALDEDD
jgi:PAS domain S-box-containing protein